MKKHRNPLVEQIKKLGVVVRPRKSRQDPIYINALNKLVNMVHANKIVAIWTSNPASMLSEIHRFGPDRYFLVNCGGNYFYVIRYNAYMDLTQKPK